MIQKRNINFAFFLLALLLWCSTSTCNQIPNNAGILPYSIIDGKIYVLLGEEVRGDNYYWSEFVGHIEGTETPEEAAVREFWEETRHIYDKDDSKARLSKAKLINNAETNTFIYVVRVEFIPSNRLSNSEKTFNYGKDHYCWFPLNTLLESIDNASSRNDAVVPEWCGGKSNKLFSYTYDNLKGEQARKVFEEIEKEMITNHPEVK